MDEEKRDERKGMTGGDLREIERAVRGAVDLVFGLLRLWMRLQRRRASGGILGAFEEALEEGGEALNEMDRGKPLYGAPSIDRRIRSERKSHRY